MIKILLFLSIVIYSSFTSAANTTRPFANSWNISKGLVNNNVYSVAEDQFGRVWLATPGGVSIVDGLGVTNLRSDSTQTTSISSNVITKVIAHKGHMLVLGLHGIDVVNPRSLTATPVNDPGKLLVRATNILFVDDDTALVVAQNRLIRWNIATDTVELEKGPASQLKVNAVYPTTDPNINLLSSFKDYYLYNHQDNTLNSFSINGFERSSEDVRANLVDSEGRLWISVFGKGIYIVENGVVSEQFNTQNSSLNSNLISKLLEKDGLVYAVTRRGVEVYDTTNLAHLRTIQPTSHNDSYMKSDMALTANFKMDGSLLIGTTDGFYVIQNSRAQPYFKLSEQLNGIGELEFFDSFTANRHLLVRGRAGLLKVTEEGTAEQVSLSSDTLTGTPVDQDKGMLLFEDNTMFDLASESGQKLEVSGLPQDSKLTRVIRDNSGGRIFLLDDTHIYIGEKVGSSVIINLSREVGDVLVADAEVSNGMLYLATQRAGLLSIPFSSISDNTVPLERIAGPEVPIQITKGSNNQLWVLTLEDGYYYHDDGDSSVQLKKFGESLPDFSPVCFMEDKNGYLWFVTNSGVSIFNQNLDLVGRYYNEIEVNERFTVNSCGLINNKVFISTPVEVFVFEPWQDQTRLPVISLGYSNISVNGESTTSYQQQQYIEPSLLTFELYSSSLNIEPSYKLLYRVIRQGGSGFEEKWIESSSRLINLIKPNVGDFVLESKVQLTDGTESPTASYSFSIAPPYYRSAFMIFLYIFIAISVLSLLFFYKLKLKDSQLQVAKVENEKQQEYARLLTKEVAEKTRLYKQQQQVAVQANIDKTRFIASASHDIRAPLNAIRWKLHDMLDASQANTKQVMEEMSTLDQLVQSIVNLSKFDAKVIKPKYATYDFHDQLEDIKERFAKSLKEKNITLMLNNELASLVYTDKFLLQRLMNNIIDNAVKNIEPGSAIIITAKEIDSGEKVLVTIKDNGQGMSEEFQSIAFDSFARGTKKYSGTGLGLTIVKQIANVLEIDLKLHSHGRGTCYTFKLLASAEKIDSKETQKTDHQMKALVIDDDPFYANDARAKLKELNFKVDVIDDISRIDSRFSDKYHIVVSDYNLGEIFTGVELIKNLTQSGKLQVNKIVIMSEDKEIGLIVKGQYQFLRKPIKRSKLSWLCQQDNE